MEDVPALSLLHKQKIDLQTLSDPIDSGIPFDKYVSNVSKTISSTENVLKQISEYAKHIENELEKVREVVDLSIRNSKEQMKNLMLNYFQQEDVDTHDTGGDVNNGKQYPPDIPVGGGGNVDRSNTNTPIDDVGVSSAGKRGDIAKSNIDPTERILLALEKKQQELIALIEKTEADALKIGKNASIDLLNQYRDELKVIEDMIKRFKEEKERKLREKEAEEKAKQERAARLQREAEEKARREKEEAERLQRQAEEKARREKEEAERLLKEKEEKAKREKEEAERLRKYEEERPKREAERLRKEKEEKAKREKEEAERLEKAKEEKTRREKEEAERLRKEKEEKAKRIKEEAERLRKEKEDKAKRDKEEAERLRKEKEEKAKREKEETERLRKEKEEKLKQEKIEAERLRKENEEKLKREKEEAERLRKEREEKLKQEKIEAERLQKEKEERLKREKEEAERFQKEKEEKAKLEKEEAERLLKEKEEKAKREKEEAERLRKEKEEKAKREKEKAERLRREREEKTKREKEEAERLRKEKEDKAKRDKEEAERLRKEKEEKAKREKEEKAKREKEEAERLQKEKEEAERLRREKEQEEEAKRRDWKNWPYFLYKNKKSIRFTIQDICCVVFTMADGFTQDELICSASDDEIDLATCLESNDEQLISPLITIKSKNGNRKFEMPIRVYVPVLTHDRALVSTLKFTIKGKKWTTGEPLPIVHMSKHIQGVTFVGVEIPTKHLECVQCVAVARPMRDETEVDEKGKDFIPEGCRNIKLTFPPKVFKENTIVGITAVPRPSTCKSKKHKELRNVKQVNSYNISCGNTTAKDSVCKIVDAVVQNNPSVNQETLTKCKKWLEKNMNPDDDILYDVFGRDFVDELKTIESHDHKNKHIIRKLQDSSEREFDKFVECLKSTQPDVADRILDVKEQVDLSRKIENEGECDNDFDASEGTMVTVLKVDDRSWKIVPTQASKDHPNARFVKLPAGHDKFQVLGLVVPNGMSDEDICRAAEILESLNYGTNVSVICRQKHTNPHDCIIQCVKSEDLQTTLQHLATLGYSDGPANSSEFGVIDGEEIEMKVEPNLSFSNTSLKVKFYKNLPLQRYSGNLSVVNKKDQQEDEQYYGNLTYNVPPGRQSHRRNGALIVYVPKPLKEIIGNFPYTLEVPVKALAKFISWQLTKDNFNSTRWINLALYLTDSDRHIYNQILQHVDKDTIVPPQRERCEIFILYWADHHAQYGTDKIEKIISCHRDKSLESEARQFIMPYLPGKGILSNDNLEKMALVIANDWQTMAKKLGFSNEDINNITSNQTVVIKQTLRMLDVWRLSDSAIQKGTDLIKSLRDTAKSLKCGTKLLSIISNYV